MSFSKKLVEVLLYDLIAIIDSGYTKTVEEVEKQIKDEKIANYIYDKYKNVIEMNIISPTNLAITNDRIKIINSEFWDGISSVKNSKDFRINKSDNGLLFVISIGVSINANKEGVRSGI